MKKLLAIMLVLALLFSLSACTYAQAAGNSVDAAALIGDINAVVDTYIEELYDFYAAYYTPEQFAQLSEELQGSFGGVGVSMVVDAQTGEITVYRILTGTPAANSVIAVGDVILKVDEESLLGKDSYDASALIRGQVGTTVKLTLRRATDGEEYSLELTRALISDETVIGQHLAEYPGTAYIHISSFTKNTASEFTTLYNNLNKELLIERLILDLRSNGGGLFLSSIEIGEYFVPLNGLVVSEKTSTETKDYRSSSGQLSQLPIVILQNSYTASAAEVLIGAIDDQASNVTLVGNTTYGKGITQTVAAMPSGHGRRYTRSIYYTPSGFSLHGIGLEPDIVVEDPENITAIDYFSYDPTLNPHLQAALDIFYLDGAPELPEVEEEAATPEDPLEGNEEGADNSTQE